MKVLVMIAALLVNTSVAAADYYTAQDIAKLPNEKVMIIRNHCLQHHPTNYVARLYCEEAQFAALFELIKRGSVKIDDYKLD